MQLHIVDAPLGAGPESLRHCERSEAIHRAATHKLDCFAALAMTRVGTARKHPTSSFPDVQLHIVDAPLENAPGRRVLCHF